jgi:hypothetical protein
MRGGDASMNPAAPKQFWYNSAGFGLGGDGQVPVT